MEEEEKISRWSHTQMTREVRCPKCRVKPGQDCVYPSGRKTTTPHMERGKAYLESIGREEFDRRHKFSANGPVVSIIYRRGKPPMSKNDVVDVEESSIVHIPKKQQEANVSGVPMEQGKTSLDSIYDHYQKKLYVFDRSGSMASGMAAEDEKGMYVWDKETLDKFRELIVDVTIGQEEDLDREGILKDLGLNDDQKLIDYIIEKAVHRSEEAVQAGIHLKRDWAFARRTESKIEAVRGAMKKFVEQRFKKYPDAQVGMIGFGSHVQMMCYPGAPKPEVMMSIDSLDSSFGGTDIVAAIKKAIAEFKRRPSHVQSHHIVMVTDAEANMSPAEANSFLHQMKEMNIMFDFIYVRGEADSPSVQRVDENDIVQLLKRMCRETGGEYAEVSKSSDFEEKFLQASNRLALPPYTGR